MDYRVRVNFDPITESRSRIGAYFRVLNRYNRLGTLPRNGWATIFLYHANVTEEILRKELGGIEVIFVEDISSA